MIVEQDIAALEACFDPIPVAPGDTLLVPGGMPHALGPGLFLIELQEPTDWVVRFEFERGGFVLPEAARFMQRGLDFCLDVFDLTPRSREDVLRTQRCAPKAPVALGPRSWREERIGAERTPCFGAERVVLGDRIEWTPRGLELWIVTSGALRLQTRAAERRLGRYEKVLLPAGLDPVMLEPESSAEILICRPPA
jgi:mannose-6-phosphate isomerase